MPYCPDAFAGFPQAMCTDFRSARTQMQSYFSGAVTGYNAYDLNGDGVLESADYSFLENNSVLGIQVVKP